ncbi:hypothetical protein [Kitasatospora sp. NPDC088134]|uniref:hypothetical protein n=1 Tax=Kitasatospora sp. NPDC088134 TaxID=3364071 RepID=UPI0037F11590
MPAERCPRCGTARTAGRCACDAASPVEDTAVLPLLDGPQLVRPYVAGASVVEPGDPAADPFATRVGPPPGPPPAAPPVQPIVPSGPFAAPPPPGRPPHVPQAASPFGPPQAQAPQAPHQQPQSQPPQPDAAATQLLPPVPPQGPGAPAGPGGAPDAPFALGRVVVPPQSAAPAVEVLRPAGPVEPAPHLFRPEPAGPATRLLPPVPAGPAEPGPPPADLGMFTFREEEAEGPVSRADRRERRKQSADRKRLVIAGGAVGVTALGASLAMLLSSSPTKVDNALPAPTGPAVSSPVQVTPDPSATSVAPAPSTPPPSPSRTTARPTQAVSKPAVAPSPPPAPSSPAAPSPSPSAAPTAGRVLKFGDTGPEVTAMQQKIMTYWCNRIGPLTMDTTRSGQPGFGDWTRQRLSDLQHDLFDGAKPAVQYKDGVYDAVTQLALLQTPQSPNYC